MLTCIELSQKNIEHNIRQFRRLVKKGVGLVAVVKANAYGHGVRELVLATEALVEYFQVDDFIELREIRQYTSKPVLVLGYVADDELIEAIKLGGILTVYDEARLRRIDELACKLNQVVDVHIKIDAQLGRQGMLPNEVDGFLKSVKFLKNINIDGVYSHFANIEDTQDFSHAQKQINTFESVVNIFREAGFVDIKTHISASSGIMAYEQHEHKSKLVRLGLSLYGMWPSEDLRLMYSDKIKLKPVIRWVTHIAQVKTLPKNHSIGYGLTFVTKKPTKVAIIPQGYSDGFDRGFSNCGSVLIHGDRCPILGRVAMNMFVVDVTRLKKVTAGDEVVILGKQEKQEITAEELAEKINTINYEITTRIWPKLPRVLK